MSRDIEDVFKRNIVIIYDGCRLTIFSNFPTVTERKFHVHSSVNFPSKALMHLLNGLRINLRWCIIWRVKDIELFWNLWSIKLVCSNQYPVADCL